MDCVKQEATVRTSHGSISLQSQPCMGSTEATVGGGVTGPCMERNTRQEMACKFHRALHQVKDL